MKRPGQVDDGDVESGDSEITGAEDLQLSSRRDSRKRIRLSHEGFSDGGSDQPSDDDEMFYEQQTQFRTQERNGNHIDNAAADNGILESVSCSNFMCHGYLEVALGPLINFIIGHNGSGKSAVLTAITICLGGKATATNRGQSLKNFIKEGTEVAVLSVKIRNRGDSAYQPEIYGDSITVERHFNRSGNSNFKLKSASGRLISTRKADLEEICDYFALQIDNPMNVLTQDMARQFLSNSTPQEKYKFFMKGTQLEHLDGDYLQIEQSIDRIDQDLAKRLGDLGHYEEDARKAKTALTLSEKHESLGDKIRSISDQMAWSQVEDVERKLAATDNDLAEIVQKLTNAERKANEVSEAFDVTDEASRRADAVVQQLQASLIPHTDQKAEAKSEYEKTKEDTRTVQYEQRKIKELLKQTEVRIGKAESAIQEEYRRLEEVNGGSNARLWTKIEEKRNQLSDAERRLNDHKAGLPDLEARQTEESKALEQSRSLIAIKRQEVQACEERLNRLVKSKGKLEGAYPANLPRLLRAIEEDGSFQQVPVGPIGYHVRLLRPSWSSILEKSFGAVLNTFIVTSKRDQSRLSELMGRCQCQCSIMIGNNDPVDTTDHEPDIHFDTALRILEIDNDLVRKQMIINQAIEQTILIDNRQNAVDAMSDARLRNVKQCFAPNVRPGTGIRFSYGWGGGLTENYVPAFNGPPRMKTDVEFQINACRAELQRLRSELNDLERTMRDRQNNLKHSEQAITRHKRDFQELRIEVRALEAAVAELQDTLDKGAGEEGKLEALKGGLSESKDELATYEASFGDSVIAVDKGRDSMRIARERMKAIDDEMAEVEAKIHKAESERTKMSERRAAALREKNSAFAEIEQIKKAQEKKRTARADIAETVDIWSGEAGKVCPRVEVDRGETYDSLEKKMEKLQADLKRAESQLGGTRQELAQRAAHKVRAFRQAREQVTGVERLAQSLKSALVHRKERWKLFQRAITARARVQFMWMLSERNFRGRLLANHKEKKLDLHVEPDPTKVGRGREAKTLSGGEKSFSTICLLLSLWDAMGAPIRCLDEFDVFMDSVNREIEAARYSIGKQFILITPGSMGSVSSNSDVKIIKYV
ncbi:MAG: hypothetical protein Q9219_006438 [cf. Caloplaca sp. 3 TL-2023]